MLSYSRVKCGMKWIYSPWPGSSAPAPPAAASIHLQVFAQSQCIAYAASRKTFVTFALKAAAIRGPALCVFAFALAVPRSRTQTRGDPKPTPKPTPEWLCNLFAQCTCQLILISAAAMQVAFPATA